MFGMSISRQSSQHYYASLSSPSPSPHPPPLNSHALHILHKYFSQPNDLIQACHSAPTTPLRVGGRLFVLLPKVIMPWHSVYTALCCILCGWLKVSLYISEFFFPYYFLYYFCCIFFLYFLWFLLHSVLSVLFCLKNFKRVIFAICLIAKSQRSRRRLWIATVTVSNDERDRAKIVQVRWRREPRGIGYLASQSHTHRAHLNQY